MSETPDRPSDTHPKGWVIRAKAGHVRLWTMDETRAKAKAAEWGLTAVLEPLGPRITITPEGWPAGWRDALRTAVSHLEHMSAWITGQKAGYSFESLGEDWDLIRAPLAETPTSSAIDDIAAERRRQIEVEGWTPEHDDEHDGGQMAAAAANYAQEAHLQIRHGRTHGNSMPHFMSWTWGLEHWKPADPRRNLVKAGALLVAEIERIDRASGEAS